MVLGRCGWLTLAGFEQFQQAGIDALELVLLLGGDGLHCIQLLLQIAAFEEVVLEFFLHLMQLQQGEFGFFPGVFQLAVASFQLLAQLTQLAGVIAGR